MLNNTLTMFYWGFPITSLILSLTLFLLLFLSKKDLMIKTFMLLVLSTGLWSFASLMMKLNVAPGTLFWNRMMVAGSTLLPYFSYVFLSVYIQRGKWIYSAVWGIITASLIAINFMGLITLSAEMVAIEVGPFIELQYTLGWGAYFAYAMIFVQLISCFILAHQYKKKSISITKGLNSIVIALFIIFIGMGINLLPVLGKYPFDFFAGSIAVLMMMRAIYENRVLELRIVITKALVLSGVLVVLTVSISLLLNRAWDIVRALNLGISDTYISIGAMVIGILLFQPIFNFIFNIVNRLFYKEEKQRELFVHEFTQSVANNLDVSDISNELINVTFKILHHGRIYLYLKNANGESFDLHASTRKLERSKLHFDMNHAFVHWFCSQRKTLTSFDLEHNSIFKSMWEDDISALNEQLFDSAIPLFSHNDLIGFMLLCHNNVRSVEMFEHIESVELICTTASMALTNALMFEKAKMESITDSLTNSYNHRYFMESLDNAISTIHEVVSLLLFGVDSLTIYNDIYGHIAGDDALMKISDRIKRSIHEDVDVFRYAGDIFAIILPHYDTKKSYDLAERIRSQIEHLSVSGTKDNERFVTVSVGLCSLPTAASDAVSLLRNANTALLFSKRNGRNRSTIYNLEVSNDPQDDFALSENQWATIYALTATIDAKDHITFGHSQRVAQYATAIAKAVGADDKEIEIIRQASLLHDIGKIGVPENILTKTTRLSEEEFEVMKRHVDLSVTIIKYLPTFNRVIPSVIGHHERYDGKGYPRQLKGENIPFGARCIALADAFDAITSDRQYKSTHTVEYALSEIQRNSGTQFDPILAKAFMLLIEQGQLIIEPTRSASFSELRS